MNVLHRTISAAYPTCEIRGGDSSWDAHERSLKFAWFKANGGAARGGEYPAGSLPEFNEFAIAYDFATPAELLAGLARGMAAKNHPLAAVVAALAAAA